MAFNVKAENLWKEIEASDEQRNTRLSAYDALMSQLIGQSNTRLMPSDYRAVDQDWPENIALTYLSLIVPKIVIDNPKVQVRSRRQVAEKVVEMVGQQLSVMVQTGQMDPQVAQQQWEQMQAHNLTAKAMEFGLNRWVQDSDYYVTLDRLCFDFLTSFGVSATTIGVMPGYDRNNPDSPRWPFSKRISPHRYVRDSDCLHPDESIWCGHWEPVNKQDLIDVAKNAGKGAGWDIDAIESLSEGQTDGQERLGQGSDRSHNHSLDRKEIKVYQIWVRDEQQDGYSPKDGFNGSLFWLGTSRHSQTGEMSHEYIRKPQPAFCPSWGPYADFGAYTVPDSPWPLSPLLATWGQQCELNSHARAMSRSASQYKKLVLVSSDAPDLAKQIEKDPHNYVVPVDGLDKDQVVQIEVGGITDEMLKNFQVMQDRTERNLALSEAQQGNPEANVTATADAIADSESQTRITYLGSKFLQGMIRDLKSKVHVLHYEDRVRFELGPEAGEELMIPNPEFIGGGDDLGPVENYELEYEAYSMERTNEALLQRRMIEAINLAISVVQAAMQMPGVLDLEQIFSSIGDTLNIPHFASFVDVNVLNQMAQMQQQMGMMAQAQQTSGDGFFRQQKDQKSAIESGRMQGNERRKLTQAV